MDTIVGSAEIVDMHSDPGSGNTRSVVGHVGNFHASLKPAFVDTEEEGEKVHLNGN